MINIKQSIMSVGFGNKTLQQINCNGVTIINGRVIGNNSDYKEFDETKQLKVADMKRITINSELAEVKLTGNCDSGEIIADFHGNACIDGKANLSITSDGGQVKVDLTHSGTSMVGELFLDVGVPQSVFESITVNSKNNNIYVYETISANNIIINGKNGDIDVRGTFKKLTIDSKNGNIDVSTKAVSDIEFDVITKNGNVDISFSNIVKSTISADTKNGNVKNNPDMYGKYTASGSVTSKNGNVRIS